MSAFFFFVCVQSLISSFDTVFSNFPAHKIIWFEGGVSFVNNMNSWNLPQTYWIRWVGPGNMVFKWAILGDSYGQVRLGLVISCSKTSGHIRITLSLLKPPFLDPTPDSVGQGRSLEMYIFDKFLVMLLLLVQYHAVGTIDVVETKQTWDQIHLGSNTI